MPKRTLLATTILVLVACTGGSSATTSPAATLDLEGSTTTVATTVPASPRSGVNRLVIIDAGGNIITIDPDGSNPAPITDDGATERYFQPIWSPVGDRLAWGEGTSAPAV